MNFTMTTCAQNSQVFYVIYFMRWNYVVYVQPPFSFMTDKAFMRVMCKGPFSIQSLSFSVIRVIFIAPFMGMKYFHHAFIRTKLRISRLFPGKCLSTKFARLCNLARTNFTPVFKAFHRAKRTPLIFASGYIGRPLGKSLVTFFTNYFNTSGARLIITLSRTELSSILLKRVLAYGTYFHVLNITLAMANVNSKPIGGLNG